MANFDQIRQSSVIFNAGPGAMTVLQNGSTVILAGTDTWYLNSGSGAQLIPLQARITDRRLALNMGVSGFVQPPAEGIADGVEHETVLASLFPAWVTCFSCDSLKRLQANDPQVPLCDTCFASKKIRRQMVQVNFVIACENGHLDEFPWDEWVHRGSPCSLPPSDARLKLSARGAVELKSQKVSCSCGKSRTLAGTTEFGTLEKLSDQKNQLFRCSGAMPWLKKVESDCAYPVRMVQRNANNIYFSSTETSILVPETSESGALAVDRIDKSSKRATYFGMLTANDWDYDKVAFAILINEGPYYTGFTAQEIALGLKVCEPPVNVSSQQNAPGEGISDSEIEFDRMPEWAALTVEREHKDLVVRETAKMTSNELGISRLLAVPRLRRTVALRGFSRLNPSSPSTGRGRAMLRRFPYGEGADWLPAVQHTGEGIVITFDPGKVAEWEKNAWVQERANLIKDRLDSQSKSLPHKQDVTARFLLLHSFSHMLIQQLVIESGYTSASLGERIYPLGDESGILIFTAASDGDGTMGGLVELADESILMGAIQRSLEHAQWCSNDPICMESGTHGQGTFGANGAACHNCSLLPETACEYMNMALDRALLIGDPLNTNTTAGYFQSH